MHGSPKNVQVYPTQSYPTQAFQSHAGQSVNASPAPSTKASTYTTHTNHTVVSIKMSRLPFVMYFASQKRELIKN